MSPSDWSWHRKFAICLFLASFVALIIPDVYLLNGDAAWMYMPEVSKHYDDWGTTKDWSSLLFIYETRLLNEALCVIFPHLDDWLKVLTHNPDFGHTYVPQFADSLHAFCAIQLIHAACLLIFVCALWRMLKELLSSHTHGVGVVLCFALGVFLLKTLQYFHFNKDLDSYFTYLLLSACISLKWLKVGEKINKKTLIFIVVCLFHCICFRKNAICVLPVFLFSVAYYYFPSMKRCNIILLPILASCGFIGGMLALNAVLPSQKTYPQNVMMFSTLKNMAILSGDQRLLPEIKEKTGVAVVSGSESEALILCPLHFAEGVYEMDAEKWVKFSEIYVHYLKTHPREFALERLMTIIQFYTNGYHPIPVRNCVSYLNPSGSVRPGDPCWNHKEAPMYCSRFAYDKIGIFGGFLLLLGYIFIRRLDRESEWSILGVVTGIVGCAYSLSFWIVTPTPNTRYHSFSVFAACMAISLLLPHVLKKQRDN